MGACFEPLACAESAGIMESSSGNATLAPIPFSIVRRVSAFLVRNVMRSPLLDVLTARILSLESDRVRSKRLRPHGVRAIKHCNSEAQPRYWFAAGAIRLWNGTLLTTPSTSEAKV